MRAMGQPGFTLVELMVVITIVGVLAMVGLPEMNNMIKNSRIKTASLDIYSSLALARSVKDAVPVAGRPSRLYVTMFPAGPATVMLESIASCITSTTSPVPQAPFASASTHTFQPFCQPPVAAIIEMLPVLRLTASLRASARLL